MSDQTSSDDALIGTWLGSCRVERRLGAGGMSAVYLAQQERPRRYVAVKVLRPQLLTDARQWPLFLARFRREADATAALDHANIVPIYEFGEQDDLAYLIMPYLPNGSLAELLAQKGPLPIPQALTYADQIASALDYAHQHGIVHRDVKPSNLLIHPDGRLLLADFGIARPLDQRELPGVALMSDATDDAGLTVGGVALGTPDYMSPEQIRGERVGPAADIYALGVVSYAMLTGRSPFGGAPTMQVLGRQLNDPPPPLRLARPDAPAQLEEVIFWALAKEASDRPASAGAFAQAMRGAAGSSQGALWKRAAGPGASLATYRGADALAAPVAAAGLAAAGDATLYDPSYHGMRSRQFAPGFAAGGAAGGGGAAWPGARAAAGGAPRRGPGIPAPLLAAVGLALVVLVIMGVVVASALGNDLASLGGGNGGPGASATSVTTPTPTATLMPTPTATIPANWLSVSTDSLTLGCKKSTKTQYIKLTNSGPSKIEWAAQVSDSGIQLSASQGDLPSMKTVTITVTNTSEFVQHQGEIDIAPQTDGAGADAVIAYTTQACFLPQG